MNPAPLIESFDGSVKVTSATWQQWFQNVKKSADDLGGQGSQNSQDIVSIQTSMVGLNNQISNIAQITSKDWTPAFVLDSGSVSYGQTNFGRSYSIGNLGFIQFETSLTSISSPVSASLQIANMPLPTANNIAVFWIFSQACSFTGILVGTITTNSDRIILYTVVNGVGSSVSASAFLTNYSIIGGSAIYSLK